MMNLDNDEFGKRKNEKRRPECKRGFVYTQDAFVLNLLKTAYDEWPDFYQARNFNLLHSYPTAVS
jgi:hypothetical protein